MQGWARVLRRYGAWAAICLLWSACTFEFSEREQRTHGTVGVEMFRVMCLNLAAQAFPNDLTGERFFSRCEGKNDAPFAELAPKAEIEQRALLRFNALLSRRKDLVPALEATFGSDVFKHDELRDFLANLIPLYDPPQLFPQVTRESARLLTELIREDDPTSKAAISALERMGARDGYRPLRLALGVVRPSLEYPDLDNLVTTTLASIDPKNGDARKEWQDLLRAGALDLATADATPADPKKPGTLAVARKLLFASDDAFSAGKGPLYVAGRDHRGLVSPVLVSGQLPAPFKDTDGDGFADIDALGRIIVSQGKLATPFRTLSAAMLGSDHATRDQHGRAFNMDVTPFDVCTGASPATGCGVACDDKTPCADGLACGDSGTCVWNQNPPLLFSYLDADRMLISGVTRDLGPLLVPKDKSITVAALHDFAYGLNAVLGDQKMRSYDFGKAKLAFKGPDTSTGPIFDLVYALGNLLPFAETDQLLQAVQALTRDHEKELAGLIEAILYIDARADAHPEAHWEIPHDFWDDLLAWNQRVLKRPGLLEAMLRAMSTEAAAKAGPLMGNFMRFKDRVTYPHGTQEELTAEGIDLKQAVGHVQGNANDATTAAVQANRENVNFPCQNPPTGLVGGDVSDPGCLPQVPHPTTNHKGIRGCPSDMPVDGSSCATAGGYGLCSWDAGSCTCDCAGGLCRGAMTPTWTCNDVPTPGYSEWVDRSQPDNRMGADGHSNQSLFQRTAALVHDLHVPGKLCNKANAEMKLYSPAGGNDQDFLGAILGAAPGGLLGPFVECGLLNEPQIVQFFTQSILGRAELKIKASTLNGLLNFLDSVNINGLTADAMMERQSQIRGLVVHHTTPQAVARMVFSPFNAFEDGLLDLPVSRDGKLIADLHRDTIFAWEIKDPVSQASYYESLTPLLTAFDDHELRDGSGNLTDGYLFGDLISIVHRHWSSRKTDATVRTCEEQTSSSCQNPPCCDLTAPLFAYQSNGVSYEELVAEALIDAQLLARIRDVLLALDSIEVAPGVDGITVLARVTENLLDPTKSCLNGDCAQNPLKARSGAITTTTNSGKPIANISPAYLLFDALNAMDKRFEGDNEKRLAPWRQARSQLVDVFLDVTRDGPGAWRFANPRSKPTIIQVSGFLRDRLTEYNAAQKECLAQGKSKAECQQVREWATGLTARLEKSLSQPVSAGALNLLEKFWGAKSDPGGQLLKMAYFLSQAQSDKEKAEAVDSTLLATADLLQLFDNSENMAPVMRFLSRAIAPNALEVAEKGGTDALDLESGAVEKTLELMRAVKRLDPAKNGEQSTLTKLLGQMVKVTGKDGETPLEIIFDVIGEVNRAAPGSDMGKSLNAADLRAVLGESRDFLASKRHGIERLYDIIQARELK